MADDCFLQEVLERVSTEEQSAGNNNDMSGLNNYKERNNFQLASIKQEVIEDNNSEVVSIKREDLERVPTVEESAGNNNDMSVLNNYKERNNFQLASVKQEVIEDNNSQVVSIKREDLERVPNVEESAGNNSDMLVLNKYEEYNNSHVVWIKQEFHDDGEMNSDFQREGECGEDINVFSKPQNDVIKDEFYTNLQVESNTSDGSNSIAMEDTGMLNGSTANASQHQLGIPKSGKKNSGVRTTAKRYNCDVCNKSCISLSKLEVHSRVHTNVRPYKCIFCNKDFKQKVHLIQHSSQHTTYRPYKCTLCEKAYPRSYSLMLHMRIHINYKPFKCNVCNIGFPVAMYLKRHVSVHTNEQPYKCGVCSKAFRLMAYKKRHERIHKLSEQIHA